MTYDVASKPEAVRKGTNPLNLPLILSTPNPNLPPDTSDAFVRSSILVGPSRNSLLLPSQDLLDLLGQSTMKGGKTDNLRTIVLNSWWIVGCLCLSICVPTLGFGSSVSEDFEPQTLVDPAEGVPSLDSPEIQWKLRNEFFLLNYTNFNHGSFGACPKSVLDYQASLRRQQEEQPDLWFRKVFYELMNQTREELAKYIGLDPSAFQNQIGKDTVSSSTHTNAAVDGLVLVESASTAVNSILRSFPWTAGDKILHFSLAYPMVKYTSQWIASQYPDMEVVVVPVSLQAIMDGAGAQAFIQPMEQALDELEASGGLDHLKMVILDHMISAPAIREPIQELAALVKRRTDNQVFVLVDGAHCMGQVQQLNLPAIGNMDAYLSNGHKWLYSPKGSAILWVNQTSPYLSPFFPEPTVISSENPIPGESNSLVRRYSYVSTRDYTALLSMGAALQFRQEVLGGEANIYEYCHGLAWAAKTYLLQLWPDVSPIDPSTERDDSLEDFMINIQVPLEIDSEVNAKALMDYMLEEHSTYMVVLHDPESNLYFTRLSAQVYLTLDDFKRMGVQVLEFCTRLRIAAASDSIRLL